MFKVNNRHQIETCGNGFQARVLVKLPLLEELMWVSMFGNTREEAVKELEREVNWLLNTKLTSIFNNSVGCNSSGVNIELSDHQYEYIHRVLDNIDNS